MARQRWRHQVQNSGLPAAPRCLLTATAAVERDCLTCISRQLALLGLIYGNDLCAQS